MVHHPSEGDEAPGEPLLSSAAADSSDRPDATPGKADPARADDRTAEQRRRDGWFPV